MRIDLISVGSRMPEWVRQGYEEYSKRLPKECELVLREIAPGKRLKSRGLSRLVQEEGKRMLASVPRDSHVVVLEPTGKEWNSEQLAESLARWQSGGRNVALLVGGPDGLAEACRQRADESWSLSRLTFPHPLARIIVAEQIYRAFSLLCNHPYHK